MASDMYYNLYRKGSLPQQMEEENREETGEHRENGAGKYRWLLYFY